MLSARIGRALQVAQEHIDILHAILQGFVAPFDFVEEQLSLQTARHLKRGAAVVRRDSMRDEQVALDLPLDRGLQARATNVMYAT